MPTQLALIFLFISFYCFGQKINISPDDTAYFKRLDYSENYRTLADPLQCQLKDSIKNGYYLIFYTGKGRRLALEGLVENNKKEGTWTTYYKHGGIAAFRNYENGKLNGEAVEYDLTGALIFEGNYVDNKLEGLAKTYFTFQYNNGRWGRYSDANFGSFTYSKGRLDGPADFWTNDSTVHVTCNYKNNSKDGKVIYKNEYDQLLQIVTYENGRYVSTEKFEFQTNETTYAYWPINIDKVGTTPEQISQAILKIDSCQNLHRLTLSNYSSDKTVDSLIQLHLASLSNLAKLDVLKLVGPGFTCIPKALFQCVNLKKLILENTSITRLPEEVLNFKILHSLELNRCKFKDIDALIKTIAQLKNLKELELSDLTTGVPKNIHLLTQIEALYFVHRYSNLTVEEFPIHPDLFRMKNLKAISLPTSLFYDPKFMASFEKKLPRCKLLADETCFAASVHITLADHSTKPISAMKVGDLVMAYDFSKSEVDTAVVRAVHVHANTNRELMEITFSGNVEDNINCTGNHPFLTLDHRWVDARELKVGNTIYWLDQTEIRAVVIKDLRTYKNSEQVFNISTSKENYFANGILVHNK